jgi:hypothetical protein
VRLWIRQFHLVLGQARAGRTAADHDNRHRTGDAKLDHVDDVDHVDHVDHLDGVDRLDCDHSGAPWNREALSRDRRQELH